MKISHEKPPCYEKLCKHFEWLEKAWNNEGIYITYGGILYTPHTHIPGHIMAHEEVHARQQKKMGADEYLDKYIADVKFRQEVEIEAYRAQVKWIKEHDVADRKLIFKHIVHTLITFYGLEMTAEQARKLLYII